MSDAPRTAFVHIGMPKTGSTAVQAACDASREVLADQGFHYLSGDRNHSEWLSMVFWDEADALRLAGFRWQDGAAAKTYCDGLRAALEAEVEAVPGHLILSAEGLSMFRESEVARLSEFLSARFDRVRVIAWLREPVSWAISAAQQAVKWSGEAIDDLFERPRLPDYAGRFGPWLRVFGDVSFHAFGDGDIVDGFSKAISLPTPLPPGERMNEAVSHRTVILLSEMNRLAPPFVDARHNPFRSYSLIRDARLPGRRFSLPRETVEDWAEALDRERDWANAALGARVFATPELPQIGRSDWMAGERSALEGFAAVFLEKARATQNERALRMYLKACEARSDMERAVPLLDQAWLLATDRWSLDRIAREALEQDRGDREKFFTKGRLMRRIEAPEPGDMPLVIGNPFDRPWCEDGIGAMRHAPAA